MKDSVIIPSAMILCVDDLGWHSGSDMRHRGQPSRTGMPRKHLPADYIAITSLARLLI
ncbi:MAG: hypothetical protein IKU45_06450 [Clostridia bacterium]|nr:hypothetical protein [Clostridia bacterium]